MTLQASSLRQELSKIDFDPGYFSKFVKDQIVRKFIVQNQLRSILDIGCDTCYMDALLDYDNFEYSYIGVDQNSNFKYCVGKQSKALVLNDTVHNYIRNIPEQTTFDVILLLDIIEHMDTLESGIELLKLCLNKLSIGNYCIISTPNKIGEKINWPKFHKHEYNYKDIIDSVDDRFKLEHFVGWSYSGDGNNLPNSNNLLPGLATKVLYAFDHPETSRDVVFIYRRIK